MSNFEQICWFAPKPSLTKVVGLVAVLAMLFPWVSLGILHTDIQPWYIVFGGGFILLCFRKRVPCLIWLSYLMPVLALLVGIVFYEKIGFLTARGVLSYLGMVVSIHAFYLYRKYCSASVVHHLVWVNIIWLLAGFLQLVFGKYILVFLVSVRTDSTRGVTSLAPEPSFFAVFLVFLSWLIWIESDYKLCKSIKVLLVANLFAVVFLAKSALGVILVGYFFFVYFVIFMRRRSVLKCGLVLFLGGTIFVSTFPVLNSSTRISRIYSMAIENPLSIVKVDASINSRVAHVVLPLYGSALNAFLPSGYYSYQKQSYDLANSFAGLFWYGYGGTRIMSTISAAIYELGFFSLFFFFILLKFLWNGSEYKNSALNLILMFSYLFAAIPVSFPLIGMILSAAYFRQQHVLRDVAKKCSLPSQSKNQLC